MNGIHINTRTNSFFFAIEHKYKWKGLTTNQDNSKYVCTLKQHITQKHTWKSNSGKLEAAKSQDIWRSIFQRCEFRSYWKVVQILRTRINNFWRRVSTAFIKFAENINFINKSVHIPKKKREHKSTRFCVWFTKTSYFWKIAEWMLHPYSTYLNFIVMRRLVNILVRCF